MVSFIGHYCSLLSQAIKGNALVAGRHHEIHDIRQQDSRRVREVAFLAEGAFGSVVKVREIGTGADYALKKIRCEEGMHVTSSYEAAMREVNILTTISSHPNIIHCLGHATDDFGEDIRVVKLLLELCSGGHLIDFMERRQGKLSMREIFEVLAHATSAVRHLHSQDPPIQHRDLKAENLLRGAHQKWKLCDFGSCSTETVSAEELPRSKQMRLQEDIDKTVTMLYRPPEMADVSLNFRFGYAITDRVDIWMLGCILYTLAFYRHPFQDNATALAIINARYFVPNEHPNAGCWKLCGLIHWFLAADPKYRPSSAKILELLKDIGRVEYEDLLGLIPPAILENISRLQQNGASRNHSLDEAIPTDLSKDIALRERVGSIGSLPSPSHARISPTSFGVENTKRRSDSRSKTDAVWEADFTQAP